MPKIAILLATYNGMQWLEEQLNSILNQKSVNLTVFISVDESSDGTLYFCQTQAQLNRNVIILSQVDRLGGAALNFFRLIHDVNFTAFEYIAFSDQDDIWHDNKISRAIEQLKINNCDGYSSNVTAFWPDGKTLLINKAQPQVEWDYLFESAGPGCTFVLTQRLALELQSFVRSHPDEMQLVWMHDWFIYAFARAHGYCWTIDSQPSMQYRQHINNQVGVNLGFKAVKHRAAFILSGKWFEQAELIAYLVNQATSDFAKTWLPFSRLDFIRLAFQAKKCRRKRSEQVLFFFICLLMALKGQKSNRRLQDEN
jgi:rhamnosyltransferase